MNLLTVSPSPHVRGSMTTQRVMLCVVISLIPAVIASGIIFGLKALMLISVCVISCIFFEGICRKIMKKEQTIGDMSTVVTGVLLALNLPVTLPWWMAVIGSFVAIVVVKQLFGGLGQNFANPAIVARIVLMVSFGSEMTKWAVPQYWKESGNEIITAATPLVTENLAEKASFSDLFFGFTGGCLGETCALALLIGGIYLIVRRIISPVTPAAFIGTVGILAFIYGLADGGLSSGLEHALYQILSGGLILGAFFMATDYVTTPVTQKGKLIFGIGCGIITFLIRQFGSYPEGVSFSILLMNIVTPYIDRFTMLRPVGFVKEDKKK
ncbi:MAG: RnfABCDGE type electron transport complex subunit D [Porcipelethomonas sp.]